MVLASKYIVQSSMTRGEYSKLSPHVWYYVIYTQLPGAISSLTHSPSQKYFAHCVCKSTAIETVCSLPSQFILLQYATIYTTGHMNAMLWSLYVLLHVLSLIDMRSLHIWITSSLRQWQPEHGRFPMNVPKNLIKFQSRRSSLCLCVRMAVLLLAATGSLWPHNIPLCRFIQVSRGASAALILAGAYGHMPPG